jgi:hypothetical protein
MAAGMVWYIRRTLDKAEAGLLAALSILVAAHAGITLKVNEGSIEMRKSH